MPPLNVCRSPRSVGVEHVDQRRRKTPASKRQRPTGGVVFIPKTRGIDAVTIRPFSPMRDAPHLCRHPWTASVTPSVHRTIRLELRIQRFGGRMLMRMTIALMAGAVVLGFGCPPATARADGSDGVVSVSGAVKIAKGRHVKVGELKGGKVVIASPGSAAKAKTGVHPTSTSCGGSGVAPWGYWGPTALANCGVFGYPGFKRGYAWSTPWWSSASMCVQGRGYNSSQKATWYGLGCGSSGDGMVPWGNVLATPAARGESYNGVIPELSATFVF